MNDRKILFFIFSVVIYCVYSFNMWFLMNDVHGEKPLVPEANAVDIQTPLEVVLASQNNTPPAKIEKKKKVIPLYIKDACSILEVFTKKPTTKKNIRHREIDPENNTITVIGITVFLLILMLNAILDVIKVKEEERARLKLNPDGERRKSLSEFANKKSLRRESSKFGLQLFQIAESVMGSGEDKKNNREARTYTRGDSTNSYLSDKMPKTDSAPPSIGETPTEPRPVKRQSIAKLIGLSDD